jgi:hypothetical protein
VPWAHLFEFSRLGLTARRSVPASTFAIVAANARNERQIVLLIVPFTVGKRVRAVLAGMAEYAFTVDAHRYPKSVSRC